MEIVYASLGIIAIAIIMVIIAIRASKKPKGNDIIPDNGTDDKEYIPSKYFCMNCGKPGMYDHKCRYCGFNELTDKLEN